MAIWSVVIGAPSPSLAQQTDDGSRAVARNLGTDGVEALRRGDYQSASEKLEKAYRVLRVPSIGVWSARALVKQGQLLKGSERYREVMQLETSTGQVEIQKQAQADAASELTALTPRLPGIVIQVEGEEASHITVSLDGLSVSSDIIGERRPVDPGAHLVEAHSGARTARVKVQLAEAETKTAVLRFAPADTTAGSAPPASGAVTASTMPADAEKPDSSGAKPLGTQRTLAIVAGGVGVVGAVVGTIFGLQARSKDRQANQHCDGSSCRDKAGADLSEDAVKAGNISTVAFVIGAVGLAGGSVLWLTAPTSESKPQVGLGFGSVQVRGAW